MSPGVHVARIMDTCPCVSCDTCTHVLRHAMLCRPHFEQVVHQLEDMAAHLDELKTAQAQTMAAAAAPLFQPSLGGHHDADPGHELTPSMMAELMPSGFGASTGVSDSEEEILGSGVLYEMSQLSGGSQAGSVDASVLSPGTGSDKATADTQASRQADSSEVNGMVHRPIEGLGEPSPSVMCAGQAASAPGRTLEGSHSLSSGGKQGSTVAAMAQ